MNMKALILAAGFGTRLRPHTLHTPKPLFTVDNHPLIDLLIRRLISAGCTAVAVNTHHLHHDIDAFLAARSYPIPVFTRYEPEILGTGGAIKNLSDFWDNDPFMVVNSDIVTDIAFKAVYEAHCSCKAPATLVLTDSPDLNSVATDANGNIARFLSPSEIISCPELRTYTFTGIQVITPGILSLIPERSAYSSIDLYRSLISRKTPPKAYMAEKHWADVGTPERYREAVVNAMAPRAFQDAFGKAPAAAIPSVRIDGDGSDRAWHRFGAGPKTMIGVDHGITSGGMGTEAAAFTAIGAHLRSKQLPVPRIWRYDLFSGWVFLEDLGDLHLQTAVKNSTDPDFTRMIYRKVIDVLIRFSVEGGGGFDPAWTCQTEAYDRPLILERECGYFVRAFLSGYLGMDADPLTLQNDFEHLADGALSGAFTGLMHRDFQSRNIMIRDNAPFVIDFQGARIGPLQYDLASLLIDPYVGLSDSLQEELLGYAVDRLSEKSKIDQFRFLDCYRHCRITRNLQMLGAFGFLSRVKGKRQFEAYIPAALQSLKKNLVKINMPEVSRLKKLIDSLEIPLSMPDGGQPSELRNPKSAI